MNPIKKVWLSAHSRWPTVTTFLMETRWPILLAALWALLGLWVSGISKSMGQIARELISNFSGAFVLTGWVGMNLNRVSYQTGTKNKFSDLAARMDAVVERLESTSQETINNLTGGDSFAYVAPINFDSGLGTARLAVIHQGRYPLLDLTVEVIDLDKAMAGWKKPSMERSINEERVQIPIGNLSPSLSVSLFEINVNNHRSGFTIVMRARNGTKTQLMRFCKTPAGWLIASRVTPFDQVQQTLYENVPNAWPRKPSGEFDFERQDYDLGWSEEMIMGVNAGEQ